MPAVDFRARLIFDEDFYNVEIKRNPRLLMKLMYINARASGYKRRFNVLPKKIFNKIVENNNLIDDGPVTRATLRSSFYDFEEETLEEIEDETERIIKYAIHIIREEPGKESFIMTSERKAEEYSRNEHFQNSEDVKVKSGREAMQILEEFWNECTAKYL